MQGVRICSRPLNCISFLFYKHPNSMYCMAIAVNSCRQSRAFTFLSLSFLLAQLVVHLSIRASASFSRSFSLSPFLFLLYELYLQNSRLSLYSYLSPQTRKAKVKAVQRVYLRLFAVLLAKVSNQKLTRDPRVSFFRHLCSVLAVTAVTAVLTAFLMELVAVLKCFYSPMKVSSLLR